MRASGAGVIVMHSAARRDWQEDPDEAFGERIVRFPARGRRPDPAAADPEPEEPSRARRRGRRQATSAAPDSLARYVLTAGALFVAVAALAFLLLQLGQLGKQVPPSPVTTVSVAPPQPPAAPPLPTAVPALPPGQGPLRVTSRVVEPSYTVVAGDTLNAIATRHGTTAEALQSINNLQDRNVLQPGQRLVIPTPP